MESSLTGRQKPKRNCPYGDDFYSRIAKALLSSDPKSLDELKEMADLVKKSKLKPEDELWDSGDEFSPEVEAVFKAANRQQKKIKLVEKKAEEKTSDKDKSTEIEMEE